MPLLRRTVSNGKIGYEFVGFTTTTDDRLSAEEMDVKRQTDIAYQYLCYLEEAKNWMEAYLEETLPDTANLEEELRHGVYLAKLANAFSVDTVPLRKIFDLDLEKFHARGLHFRHTDNINYFLKALKAMGLPSIFYPETTDVYDKKNMPKLVFCLHALSLYLFRLGMAPQIQTLYGKAKFSDAVIEAMMKELKKYNCQLPQFGKIGGILASELPVDEAALHAAVIAINEAIEKKASNEKEILATIQNPSAHLSNVVAANIEVYEHNLFEAKAQKKEIAFNKSRDGDYIPDAYDELLTQTEIQGHINFSNAVCAIDDIEMAVENGNGKALIAALKSSCLAVKGVIDKHADAYLEKLKKKVEDRQNQSMNLSFLPCILSKSSVQGVVSAVNNSKEEEGFIDAALKEINVSLDNGNASTTLCALKRLKARLPPLLDQGAVLYHEEMAAIKCDAGTDLNFEEVLGGVRLLTAVVKINIAIKTENYSELWKYLSDPLAYIQNLDASLQRKYFSAISVAYHNKINLGEPLQFLTYLELIQIVHEVNCQKKTENDKVSVLKSLNEAVSRSDIDSVLKFLRHPALELGYINFHDSFHYFQLLKMLQQAKQQMLRGQSSELWLEDVVEVIGAVKKDASEAQLYSSYLSKLNTAVRKLDTASVVKLLCSSTFPDIIVAKDIFPSVVDKLVEAHKSLKRVSKCPWMLQNLSTGVKVYINMGSGDYQWQIPDGFTLMNEFITHEIIQNVVSAVTGEAAQSNKAACQGFLVRRKLNTKKRAAVTIQAWWKMVIGRNMYLQYRKALQMLEPKIILIQRTYRAWMERKRKRRLLDYFSQNIRKVTVIQRTWKAYKARQDLHALTHCNNPPLSVVQKFVTLLEVSAVDFEEELKLQHHKSDIVKSIRNAQDLETRIEELDVKIGLLVHNRITLQDVLVHDKENLNPNVANTGTTKKKKHAKEFEKIGTVRFDKGLKTQPQYLATLIFAIPSGKTTKFIENVIFTLYNYGSNDRDNYLLIKLLKTALEEEIRCKVLRLSDIVCGNPLVIKMIITFNRKGAGHASLREMLGPLINKVLGDTSLYINTNPIEIYRTWVNQLEMKSGQPSDLPYEVTQEQALQHPEVQKRMLKATTVLREMTQLFCNHITGSKEKIPYAMLYMAKILKNALLRRFPHFPEKEILKVVGNLIYYRYINSAIVAPEVFDIVTVSPDQKLTNEQRRNLASIAKILQFAASKKGFGDEASHLKCLNSFIVECHEKFKAFFKSCCEVDEPESFYNVNKYSDATLIVKPVIYITVQVSIISLTTFVMWGQHLNETVKVEDRGKVCLCHQYESVRKMWKAVYECDTFPLVPSCGGSQKEEICETHQLLLDYEDILASNINDPLHTLLSDLGSEKPSVCTLLGESSDADIASFLNRTEVCLTLNNKFDLIENSEEKETKDSNLKLFTKSKQLLIDLLRCCEVDSIQALVTRPTLPFEERKFQAIVNLRNSHEQQAKLNDTCLNRSNSFLSCDRVSLHEVKTKLCHNLRRLENQGLASRSNGYQELLNAIASDIVNQRQYRISRRLELQKLSMTLQQLHQKDKFYRDQLQSYRTYLNTCLNNLAARNRNVHLATSNKNKNRNKIVKKYTAARLQEKGVVLDIEDLPSVQMKNVLFEISPLASTGMFEVQVKFMGVGMEQMQIDIQELLQMQYEGVIVKQMFGKAKVNVNLLLHLLNTKFYSKK